jgi:hypothetical protein
MGSMKEKGVDGDMVYAWAASGRGNVLKDLVEEMMPQNHPFIHLIARESHPGREGHGTGKTNNRRIGSTRLRAMSAELGSRDKSTLASGQKDH